MDIVNKILSLEVDDEIVQGMVVIEGMDDAVIGYAEKSDGGLRLVYDFDKIVDVFVDRDGMTVEEAMEFIDFNFHFPGKQQPIIVHSLEELV